MKRLGLLTLLALPSWGATLTWTGGTWESPDVRFTIVPGSTTIGEYYWFHDMNQIPMFTLHIERFRWGVVDYEACGSCWFLDAPIELCLDSECAAQTVGIHYAVNGRVDVTMSMVHFQVNEQVSHHLLLLGLTGGSSFADTVTAKAHIYSTGAPEPGTMLLAGIGLAAIAWRTGRRATRPRPAAESDLRGHAAIADNAPFDRQRCRVG